MKIGVCLEMVHTDLPYDQRIVKIAEAGYKNVEFWSPQGKDPAVLRQVCDARGVSIGCLLVSAPGGGPIDDRNQSAFIDQLHETISFAKAAGISMGITCTGNVVDGLTREQMRSSLEKSYAEAADIAEANDFTLVLEPLNTIVDHRGYYLDSLSEAAEIVRAVGSPAFKLLYDVYHMQIMEGNIISSIEANIDIIGHFHSAGVPGRHELMGGELNYRGILKAIAAAGYTGIFGLEYSPSYDSGDSLRATREYLAEFME